MNQRINEFKWDGNKDQTYTSAYGSTVLREKDYSRSEPFTMEAKGHYLDLLGSESTAVWSEKVHINEGRLSLGEVDYPAGLLLVESTIVNRGILEMYLSFLDDTEPTANASSLFLRDKSQTTINVNQHTAGTIISKIISVYDNATLKFNIDAPLSAPKIYGITAVNNAKVELRLPPFKDISQVRTHYTLGGITNDDGSAVVKDATITISPYEPDGVPPYMFNKATPEDITFNFDTSAGKNGGKFILKGVGGFQRGYIVSSGCIMLNGKSLKGDADFIANGVEITVNQGNMTIQMIK
ncbi:hypothetical protein DEO48_25665 [Enterobacter sp. CGMCC 5087]|uniref:hypothetical protein n=1 Tax=Enterobacter sp. CGMCC 5087 TaxID=2183878 RepID=UPI000D683F4A|nr:hypothetical protein [Enterobacter sp. CGMCC 5087]PWI77185.1 hypothetical protein DEO48_25665 [Enterobacter sp. CGMCC 5087]